MRWALFNLLALLWASRAKTALPPGCLTAAPQVDDAAPPAVPAAWRVQAEHAVKLGR